MSTRDVDRRLACAFAVVGLFVLALLPLLYAGWSGVPLLAPGRGLAPPPPGWGASPARGGAP